LKFAGGLTVLLLGGLIYLLMRKEKTPQETRRWKEAHHVR
jgi:hypothetical protein